jgi:hypothetical protein
MIFDSWPFHCSHTSCRSQIWAPYRLLWAVGVGATGGHSEGNVATGRLARWLPPAGKQWHPGIGRNGTPGRRRPDPRGEHHG